MNALVDQRIIEALYRASQAGVKVDLIVRGICCLRPGLKGISENITVRSIVDRFLEHSRIFYFENACQPKVFLGSADWMPRNFFRRIETVFPVLDGNLRERVISELLALPLADNARARLLQSDGTYRRAVAARLEKARRSQFEFIAQAQQVAAENHTNGTTRLGFPRVKVALRPSVKS
jgi:polyphosphate kinase